MLSAENFIAGFLLYISCTWSGPEAMVESVEIVGSVKNLMLRINHPVLIFLAVTISLNVQLKSSRMRASTVSHRE